MKTFLILILLFIVSLCNAQSFSLEFFVKDSLGFPIKDTNISYINKGERRSSKTNSKGSTIFNLKKGNYEFFFKHKNYFTHIENISLTKDKQLSVVLNPRYILLDDIVVTSEENKGLVTASTINKRALTHLQPSSFADILELLPGGLSHQPRLTSVNPIKIREFTTPNSQYNTGALGVQFQIDGNILNSNADLQISAQDPLSLFNRAPNDVVSRNTYNIGVDMREISTNDIQSVEIIRGIPSASYGDLTSGLVLINRISGKTKWRGRVKVDGFSKLFYISKGLKLGKDWNINASIDLLNAKSDPRNVNENYKKISSSLRSNSNLDLGNVSLKWKTILDYNFSKDDETIDPDSGFQKTDSYENIKHNIYFSNNLDFSLDHKFMKDISINFLVKKGYHNLNQKKLVQLSGPRSISIATEEGENDGYFPEINYISYLKTKSHPLDLSFKLQTKNRFFINNLENKVEAGIDYKFSKNYGDGQLYDILKPPSPNMTTRPRKYNDIPAYQNIALFLGNKSKYDYKAHTFEIYGGVRISKLLGLENKFLLNHKIYIDPRVNLQWKLPNVEINKEKLKSYITMGFGVLHKNPTLQMLYPNLRYYDFQQLNYYHSESKKRYVNYLTYIVDPTNFNLESAKNIKKEIRLDLSYGKHNLFLTYFQENMKTGFRVEERFKTFYYKRYDASGVIIKDLIDKPKLDELPFTELYSFLGYATHQNGSRTQKRGIEFGYNTPRFSSINTKFTLSGAWFKVLYENSTPLYEKPSKSIGGVSFPYVGIYKNDLGYINNGVNYNLFTDVYLKSLGMNLSLSIQGTLFLIKYRTERKAEPYAYIDKDGNYFKFDEKDKEDVYKQWLIRDVSFTDNLSTHYTMDLRANVKIDKQIYNDVKLSLFVNKLFSYYAPYIFNNKKIERNTWNEPYFGIELTFNY